MTADILANIRNGTWLDAQMFPPLEWAVPGIVPEGFGLLVGAPKLGKSWMALGLGLAVASGGAAFGTIPVDQRAVLYLALEDGDRRLQERCRRLLIGEPIPAEFQYATVVAALDVPRLMTAWLDEHPSGLVMLDTLGRVMPPAMAGESAYARDYRVGTGIKAIVDNHPGATLLVVHHNRKAGAEDWMDGTSGTQGLNGSADFTILLTRTRGETSAVLRVTGRDVADGEYAMTVTDGSWRLDGTGLVEAARRAATAKAVSGLGDRATEIVDLVGRTINGIGPTAVGLALGISASNAGTYLGRLAAAGRIRAVGRGLYVPVESVESVETREPSTLSTLSTP